MSRSIERHGPTMNEGSNTRKPCKVCVCTSALPYNVEGFVSKLQVRYPHLALDVQYFELPYNNIDNFSVKRKEMDVMILCHSIDNRRFSITDVTDALYQKFLPKAAKTLGKQNVCVIAHDFPPEKKLDNPDMYETEMASFKIKQRTTFKNAALVMMCGKLTSEGSVELQKSNWDELETFLQNAIAKKLNYSRSRYSTSMKENKLSMFVFILTLIIFLASLACTVWYVIAVITTTLPPSTTAHPKTTMPSPTDDTHVSSQGTSSLPTTIPFSTNHTTDFATQMTSSIPTTTTDTTAISTTPSEQTLDTSPALTTIPPIPTGLTPNSTDTNGTPSAA